MLLLLHLVLKADMVIPVAIAPAWAQHWSSTRGHGIGAASKQEALRTDVLLPHSLHETGLLLLVLLLLHHHLVLLVHDHLSRDERARAAVQVLVGLRCVQHVVMCVC